MKFVTVAGSGVLGAQIAFQAAFHGFLVTVYDISEAAIDKARPHFKQIGEAFKRDLDATQEQVDAAANRLTYTSDLAASVKDADLLIEAVPENAQIKVGFYEQLAKVAPGKTIFATNSSTMLPSQFAAVTGRPEKFLALHFANEIWKRNTAEVMGHPGTDPKVFDAVVEFSRAIGMVALPLHREQPGYIVNSLLGPLLDAALLLLLDDVADVQTVDKTWMVVTGARMGPFGILDMIGISTAYNVYLNAAAKDASRGKVADYLKANFLDQGKLGFATGEGFYTYPNPAFGRADFLK